MLEKLFSEDGNGVLLKHRRGPYLEERIRFLQQRNKDGHDLRRLRSIAKLILWSAELFQADISNEEPLTPSQIKAAGTRWFKKESRFRNGKRNRIRHQNFFQLEVSAFIRSMGLLSEPEKERKPYDEILTDYLEIMKHDRGCSPDTIRNKRRIITELLTWWFSKNRSIAALGITDIDNFISRLAARGYCRASLATIAVELRSFFRHAKQRKWCCNVDPMAIRGPKLYQAESIPAGPPWQDVKRLIESANSEQACDIRDLPILMLFATYGLRAYEVANLRLEDIYWDKSQIRIRHAKTRRTQYFPLVPTVGNAILRYLRLSRPKCDHRELFISLTPPIRPISRQSLYDLVSRRMEKLGIRGLHCGPHSLRHACASHLLAEGFSMKEVGDQLGHSSAKSTSVYAKVDLNHLRIVADFNFGDIL